MAVEHGRFERGGVSVIGNRVPCAEDEIVQTREWDEVLDLRGAALGAFAEADRGELREAADRTAESPARQLYARDQRGGYGSQTREKNAELSPRRGGVFPGDVQRFECDSEVTLTRRRVTRAGSGCGTGWPGVVCLYTHTMRWKAVKLVSTAMMMRTQVSTAPSNAPPKSSAEPPISRTRSSRCIQPTLQSMRNASARARVYETINDPAIASATV